MDVKALQESATALARVAREWPASHGLPGERAISLSAVVAVQPELEAVAKAAAGRTKSGLVEAWEPGAQEPVPCAMVDEVAQRCYWIAAAATAQACCGPIPRS